MECDGEQPEFSVSHDEMTDLFQPHELEPIPHIATHWKYVHEMKLDHMEKGTKRKFFSNNNDGAINDEMQSGFCWATGFQYFSECFKIRKREIDRGYSQLMFLFQYNNEIRCQNSSSILTHRNELFVSENIGSKKIYDCKKIMSKWLRRHEKNFDWDVQAVSNVFSNQSQSEVKRVLDTLSKY